MLQPPSLTLIECSKVIREINKRKKKTTQVTPPPPPFAPKPQHGRQNYLKRMEHLVMDYKSGILSENPSTGVGQILP